MLKIGDFGMAREVSEKEYYRKRGVSRNSSVEHSLVIQDQLYLY